MTSSQSPRATICIAEDDLSMSRALCTALERAAYKVIPALDGREALHIALNEDVQLVTLDIMMPRLSGLDVLEKLRQVKPDLPVILLTNQHPLEFERRARSLGASAYLVKVDTPLSKFVQTVAEILSPPDSGSSAVNA